ncbi:Dynactin subunit 1 [Nowakowskiella sp. JEL0407]|nr:Dynactin subunit 1 [Nowakowskiella sp. JEL0407]
MRESSLPSKHKSAISASSSSSIFKEQAATLEIGDRVIIKTSKKTGHLAYLGNTSFAEGKWAGIILEEIGTGKNNGTVKGVKYFEAPENAGIFVLASLVEKTINREIYTKPTSPMKLTLTNASTTSIPQRRSIASSIKGGGGNTVASRSLSVAESSPMKRTLTNSSTTSIPQRRSIASSIKGGVGNTVASRSLSVAESKYTDKEVLETEAPERHPETAESFEPQIIEWVEKLGQASEMINLLNEKMAEKDAELVKLKVDREINEEELKREIEELRAKGLGSNEDKLKREIEELRNKNQKSNEKDLKRQIKKLQTKISQEDTNHSQEISELTSTLALIKQMVQEKTQESEASETALTNQINELNSSLTEKETQIKDLQEKLESQKLTTVDNSIVEELKSAQSQLLSEKKQLESNFAEMLKKIADLEAAAVSFTKKETEMNEMIMQQQSEFEVLQRKYSKVKKELKSKSGIENESTELNAEIVKLNSQISSLDLQLSMARNEINANRNSLDSMRKTEMELRDTIESLTRELENVNAEGSGLQDSTSSHTSHDSRRKSKTVEDPKAENKEKGLIRLLKRRVRKLTGDKEPVGKISDTSFENGRETVVTPTMEHYEELHVLRNQIEQLNEEREVLKKQIEELEIENAQPRKFQKEREGSIVVRMSEYELIENIFESEVSTLKRELETACKDKEDLELKLQNVINEQTNKLNTTTGLETELTSLKAIEKDLQKIINESKEETQQKLDQIRDLDVQIQNLQSTVNELKKKVDHLEIENNTLRDNNSKLQLQNDALTISNSDAISSAKESILENTQLQAKVNSFTAEIFKITCDLRSRDADIESLKSDLSRKNLLVSEYETSQIKLKTRIAQAESNNEPAELLKGYEERYQSVLKELKEMTARRAEAIQQLEVLQNENKMMQIQVDKLSDEILKAKTNTQKQENLIESLKSQIQSKNDATIDCEQLKTKHDKELRKLETELSKVQKKLQDCDSFYEGKLQNNIREITIEIEEKNRYIEKLLIQTNDSQEAVQSLAMQFEEQKNIAASLRTKLEEINDMGKWKTLNEQAPVSPSSMTATDAEYQMEVEAVFRELMLLDREVTELESEEKKRQQSEDEDAGTAIVEEKTKNISAHSLQILAEADESNLPMEVEKNWNFGSFALEQVADGADLESLVFQLGNKLY